MSSRVKCAWLAIAAAAVVGCGGNGDTSKADNKATGGAEPQVNVAAKAWDPAAGTATIQGVVKFTGKPPKRRAVDMSGKPECGHHETPPLDESIIVNPDGSLKNTFVYVKSGLKGWKFTAPTTPVVLDQKGCTFTPHVVGVQTGQPVVIRNSDATAHNVHALSVRNPDFNFTQARQGQEDKKEFLTPEVLFKIKCDIHGWMATYVGVVEHPYFFVTGDDGRFTLKGLPPGEYTVEAVHEELGKKTATVKIGDKESKDVGFEFSR